MAIENSVSNDFCATIFDSIDIFDCRLPSVYNHNDRFQFYHFKQQCENDMFHKWPGFQLIIIALIALIKDNLYTEDLRRS